MAGIRVIITGSTGMVGEGVLFECLLNEKVSEVLIINRRHYDLQHKKLKELIVPDFLKLDDFADQIKGDDACFFCAGVSSLGMKEEKYRHLTYDTTLAFAKSLLQHNSNMVFTYVSGSHTNSTEKGKIMWARVKGKTENDLNKLGFKAQYNFRPGAMLPFAGQKNWSTTYRFIAKGLKIFMPDSILHMRDVGRAMINAATVGYHSSTLEIEDIKALALL